ncbi:MAG: DUF4177 domain-containing protein [Alkaliphilus sp.]
MFEYKFVKEPIKKIATSKKSMEKNVDNIKDLIQKEAKKGWRFVQIFTTVGEGLIVPGWYEVIFEKECLSQEKSGSSSKSVEGIIENEIDI